MRRQDKEIKEQLVIEEILLKEEVCRLATSVDDQPYVVPMNYVYNSGKIILHSNRNGIKMVNMAVNPKVCLEVDTYKKIESDRPCNYSYYYLSVIVQGRAKIVADPTRKLQLLKILVEKYAPGKGKMVNEEVIPEDLRLIEIDINEITGKRSQRIKQDV